MNKLINALDNDLTEYWIDSLIDNDTIKVIPIIGAIVAIYRTGVAVKHRILLKKIAKFFHLLNIMWEKEKIDFVQKMNNNSKFNKKVVEKLILTIDKSDDFEKMSLIAALFKNYIQWNITQDDLFRLTRIVNNVYLDDLYLLTDKVVSKNSKSKLSNSWLIEIKNSVLNIVSGDINYWGSVKFEFNNLWKKLQKTLVNDLDVKD